MLAEFLEDKYLFLRVLLSFVEGLDVDLFPISYHSIFKEDSILTNENLQKFP